MADQPTIDRLWIEAQAQASVIMDALEESTGTRPRIAVMPVPCQLWITTGDPDHWHYQNLVSAHTALEAASLTLKELKRLDQDPEFWPERIAVAPMRKMEPSKVLDCLSSDRKYQSQAWESLWDFNKAEEFEATTLRKLKQEWTHTPDGEPRFD